MNRQTLINRLQAHVPHDLSDTPPGVVCRCGLSFAGNGRGMSHRSSTLKQPEPTGR